MTDITITNHQNEAIHLAVGWYKEANLNRHLFESAAALIDVFDRGDSQLLGNGQDFFFGGFAGTGKTTVLPAMIQSMGLDPKNIAFCAPTGQAAKVMTRKLRDFGMDVTATTIHSLIYTPRKALADRIKSKIDAAIGHQEYEATNGQMGTRSLDPDIKNLDMKELRTHINGLNFDLIRAMDTNDGPKFNLKHWDDFKEDIDLIVVDEGSMVGAELAEDLAFFGKPILAMGDPGQLPPVGDDYGFSCELPDAFLTEIHRQAKDNPIIYLATRAREGKELKIGNYGPGIDVVTQRNDNATLDMDREAMVLCGTHKKRWTLTKRIRAASGYTETGPCAGEPLMFCKNSTKLDGIVNGTLATCLTDHGDLVKGQAVMNIKVQDDYTGGTYHVACAQSLFEEHYLRKRNGYTCSSTAAFDAKRQKEHLDWAHAITVHK